MVLKKEKSVDLVRHIPHAQEAVANTYHVFCKGYQTVFLVGCSGKCNVSKG